MMGDTLFILKEIHVCVCVLQKMVRTRDSPQCAICEFVMKEVEDMLQDKATEVRQTRLNTGSHGQRRLYRISVEGKKKQDY